VTFRLAFVALVAAACSSPHPSVTPDASPADAGLPAAIVVGDFPHALDKAFIPTPEERAALAALFAGDSRRGFAQARRPSPRAGGWPGRSDQRRS
jgi:hypothetical protein